MVTNLQVKCNKGPIAALYTCKLLWDQVLCSHFKMLCLFSLVSISMFLELGFMWFFLTRERFLWRMHFP